MRLGIDFGTTHSVAAIVDRGNYPVVSYDWGDAVQSLVAVRGADGSLRLGQDALQVSDDPDWTVVRSIKRLLSEAGPLTEIEAGGHSLPLLDVLSGTHPLGERREVQVVAFEAARMAQAHHVAAAAAPPRHRSADRAG